MFDDEFTHIKYYYENRELIVTENYGTYTDRKADIKGKEYGWNHSSSELLNALINQVCRSGSSVNSCIHRIRILQTRSRHPRDNGR
jgi:hypothetical protein